MRAEQKNIWIIFSRVLASQPVDLFPSSCFSIWLHAGVFHFHLEWSPFFHIVSFIAVAVKDFESLKMSTHIFPISKPILLYRSCLSGLQVAAGTIVTQHQDPTEEWGVLRPPTRVFSHLLSGPRGRLRTALDWHSLVTSCDSRHNSSQLTPD